MLSLFSPLSITILLLLCLDNYFFCLFNKMYSGMEQHNVLQQKILRDWSPLNTI